MVSGWSDTNVYPSARSSDRVVFGTGPAINLTLREQSKNILFIQPNYLKPSETYIKA